MDTNTQQERIVREATTAVIVLSRGTECTLIELTGKPDAVTYSEALIRAGFTFRGLAGIVGESVEVAPNDPLDLECMFSMGRAAKTLGMLLSTSTPDSAEWLRKLWSKPDTRSN